MSRPPPPSSWMQEPLPPRHMPPHPQDHQSHSPPLRLPPPSSLVGGASSTQATSRVREPAYTHNQYPDQYAASSAHGRFAAPETGSSTRRQEDVTTRLSPTQSPTVGHGSENVQSYMRPPRLFPGDQSSSRPSQPPPQLRQPQAPPNESQYPPNYVRPGPPAYSTPDTRAEQSRPAMLPPRLTQPSQAGPREAGRMSISGLLSSDASRAENSTRSSKAPVLQHPSSLASRGSKYKIRIRQQPVAARSCGFGERDRRVIDPPPILQMTIEDPNASQKEISTLIRYPFAVIHCTIWSDDGTEDCSAMPEEFRSTRRLMGTTVSSPFVGQDENNEEGCFFCFPDLSCRTPGTFRLKFALVVLDPVGISNGTRTPLAATVMSEPFKVYNAKDFPGMQASTLLTKKLKEQGCLISIKKGNEKNSSVHTRDSGDDDEEDDEEEAPNGRQRAAKRSRRA